MRFRRLRSGVLSLVRLRPEEGSRSGLAADCTVDGCAVDGVPHRHLDPWPPTVRTDPVVRRNPVELSARPHPPANAWPDDSLTLSYAELRALVALHLSRAAEGLPRDQPWGWVASRAQAMRDGELPLLLSEVMTS